MNVTINGTRQDFWAMTSAEQSKVWGHILDHGDDARFEEATAISLDAAGDYKRTHWTLDCAAYLLTHRAHTGKVYEVTT